jgi:ubiquitin-like 1-activating enzyme E1 B
MFYNVQKEPACCNLSYIYNSVLCQKGRPSLFSDPCREEFDEEKEPEGMVLSGWSAPAEKQVNGNRENKSAASSSSAHGTDDVEDMSAKPGMKRKLDEISETKENCGASSSAQIVEDDDEFMILDEDPMLKKKRLQ